MISIKQILDDTEWIKQNRFIISLQSEIDKIHTNTLRCYATSSYVNKLAKNTSVKIFDNVANHFRTLGYIVYSPPNLSQMFDVLNNIDTDNNLRHQIVDCGYIDSIIVVKVDRIIL
jgi:hypothetical protein